MIKKLNILVLLLVILLSIGVVSASEDVNITDDNSNPYLEYQYNKHENEKISSIFKTSPFSFKISILFI